ncbi:hypothetical protein F511_27271 [Dorcoceras hygrometricum]|uniref:Uncharacterized protein n=1 Tax=Dorcoceras hygrometricum TaxID=472368 RepID=A0A2Z7B537_9LAMI|nr:hypothetical protein F511_27271 [Dorcoceras hygrometricum]
MRNDSVWISRSDSVWISWNDSVLIDLFIPADGYSDFNQQVHYMLLTSRCISKIAKRRHLNKLERHRLSLKKSADGKTHMHISRMINHCLNQQQVYCLGGTTSLPAEESLAPISTDDMLSADERMSLDDIILTIPVDIPLPSSSMEITKIMMGKSIKIPGVTKWTWFLKNIPRITADDKGKEILVEKDPIRGNPAREHFFLICADIDLLVQLRAKIFEYQSGLSSKLHKIEQSVCDSLRDQEDIFRNLSQGARQEALTLDDVQTLRVNDFRKHVLAQNTSIFTGLADVRKEVQEVNAKVDIMASRLNAIQKDAEATKEALSHQLFEFQSSAQENHSVLHAQLSELVDYIHRGGADKKGESGSRGLQQPSNVQVSASAERTPTFAQRVEMAQRHIVHTVLDADANRALFERQDAADRDRERRRREARALKRRRKD